MPSDSSKATPVCGVCFGTGVEVVAGKGARPCPECGPSRSANEVQAAQIPARFSKCSFHNYYPKNESQQWALQFGQNLIEHYHEEGRNDGRGLLFVGPVGVGKTHLATAILRNLMEGYSIRGLFYQSGALLKKIQDSYNPISQTSELRVLAPVFEADVLVLDELGVSKPTDWVRDTLMQIINTRYNDKKLTIFTTNYPDELHIEDQLKNLQSRLKQLRESFSQRSGEQEAELEKRIRLLLAAETMSDRIGVRLRSRLYEMCQKVEIEGEDYRKKFISERRHLTADTAS